MSVTRHEADAHLEELTRQHGPLITRAQVRAAGLDPHILVRWLRQGRAQRLQRGVYRVAAAPPINHEELLEVQLRIPYAVICLVSALAFHGLTTHVPKAVTIAVPRGRKPPRLTYPPLEIFFFSPQPYSLGIQTHEVGGVPLRVYSREKTLADLLRFERQYRGLFLEGLRNYLNQKPDLHQLAIAARLRGVESKLQPLLQALLVEPTT